LLAADENRRHHEHDRNGPTWTYRFHTYCTDDYIFNWAIKVSREVERLN
jgi:hypothetical protein